MRKNQNNYFMKTIITLLALLMTVGSYSQEAPKSYSNGGDIRGAAWTIKDYQDNAKKDSLLAVKYYNNDLSQAEAIKPKEKPEKIKKKGWFAKNIVDIKENQRNENKKLKEQQEKYEQKIKKANAEFDGKIKKLQKYRDDWVAFLKAEKIAEAKAEKKREMEAEKKRINDAKDAKIAKIAKEKAEEKQKKHEAEWKAMPTNPKYKQWKVKYEKVISLAQANVDKCEAIIKKHTFKNVFGQKRYNSSDFTESDKKIYNKNLDLLGKNHDEIGDLENEKKYYFYWYDTVSMRKSTSSYRSSSYYNSKSKVY